MRPSVAPLPGAGSAGVCQKADGSATAAGGVSLHGLGSARDWFSDAHVGAGPYIPTSTVQAERRHLFAADRVMTPCGYRLLYSAANPTTGELRKSYVRSTLIQVVNEVKSDSGRAVDPSSGFHRERTLGILSIPCATPERTEDASLPLARTCVLRSGVPRRDFLTGNRPGSRLLPARADSRLRRWKATWARLSRARETCPSWP